MEKEQELGISGRVQRQPPQVIPRHFFFFKSFQLTCSPTLQTTETLGGLLSSKASFNINRYWRNWNLQNKYYQ